MRLFRPLCGKLRKPRYYDAGGVRNCRGGAHCCRAGRLRAAARRDSGVGSPRAGISLETTINP